jgi:hypothetical protein
MLHLLEFDSQLAHYHRPFQYGGGPQAASHQTGDASPVGADNGMTQLKTLGLQKGELLELASRSLSDTPPGLMLRQTLVFK